MTWQQWMWLFWIAVGSALTVAITAQVNRKRLSDCVIVPRNEWTWLVERAAKAPEPIGPITKAEVQKAMDAASEIAQAVRGVSMDTFCIGLGAEGFDGRERRLAVEVAADLGCDDLTLEPEELSEASKRLNALVAQRSVQA